jgi:hypothetical protein
MFRRNHEADHRPYRLFVHGLHYGGPFQSSVLVSEGWKHPDNWSLAVLPDEPWCSTALNECLQRGAVGVSFMFTS